MKIALLNLQYDTNYGGNLQRYALMTVLHRMGHDVTHLNLRFNFNDTSLPEKVIRLCKRLIKAVIGRLDEPLLKEYIQQKKYVEDCKVTDTFYERYIQHTPIIYGKSGLTKYKGFEAYIVGSDQVWRKSIADYYGISTYFFDFLPSNLPANRVAYGVSLGTADNELSKIEIEELTPLYSKFNSVSVREDSGLELLKKYGWNNPEPQLVLDPTFLLTKEDYIKIIEDGATKPSDGNMFCYILDPTPEKEVVIREYEKQKGLKSFIVGDKTNKVSIPQWLRSFYDSEFVITDSFHGMVFCIIFNKPFKLIKNQFRGNARFESIMRELGIPEDTEHIDWTLTVERLNNCKEHSLCFLKGALK